MTSFGRDIISFGLLDVERPGNLATWRPGQAAWALRWTGGCMSGCPAVQIFVFWLPVPGAACRARGGVEGGARLWTTLDTPSLCFAVLPSLFIYRDRQTGRHLAQIFKVSRRRPLAGGGCVSSRRCGLGRAIEAWHRSGPRLPRWRRMAPPVRGHPWQNSLFTKEDENWGPLLSLLSPLLATVEPRPPGETSKGGGMV